MGSTIEEPIPDRYTGGGADIKETDGLQVSLGIAMFF